MRQVGVIKSYNPEKGFGFIENGDKQLFFFHSSKLEKGYKPSAKDTVSFQNIVSKKKPGSFDAIDISKSNIVVEDIFTLPVFLGSIAWYDNEKGFGIIKSLNQEVFLHHSALTDSTHSLLENTKMVYILNDQKKAKRARTFEGSVYENNGFLLLDNLFLSKETVLQKYLEGSLDLKISIIVNQPTIFKANQLIDIFLQTDMPKFIEENEAYLPIREFVKSLHKKFQDNVLKVKLVQIINDISTDQVKLMMWRDGISEDLNLGYVLANYKKFDNLSIDALLNKCLNEDVTTEIKEWIKGEIGLTAIENDETFNLCRNIPDRFLGISEIPNMIFSLCSPEYKYRFIKEGLIKLQAGKELLNFEILKFSVTGSITQVQSYSLKKWVEFLLLSKKYAMSYNNQIVEIIIPFTIKNDRFELWYQGLLGEYFDIESTIKNYSNRFEYSKEEIIKRLTKSQLVLVLNKLLKENVNISSESIEQFIPIFRNLENKNYYFEKIIENCSSDEERISFMLLLDDIDSKTAFFYFIRAKGFQNNEILKKLNNEQKIEILIEFINGISESNIIESFEKIIDISSNYKSWDNEKIIQDLVLPMSILKFNRYYQSKLWFYELNKEIDLDYVLSNISEFNKSFTNKFAKSLKDEDLADWINHKIVGYIKSDIGVEVMASCFINLSLFFERRQRKYVETETYLRKLLRQIEVGDLLSFFYGFTYHANNGLKQPKKQRCDD